MIALDIEALETYSELHPGVKFLHQFPLSCSSLIVNDQEEYLWEDLLTTGPPSEVDCNRESMLDQGRNSRS